MSTPNQGNSTGQQDSSQSQPSPPQLETQAMMTSPPVITFATSNESENGNLDIRQQPSDISGRTSNPNPSENQNTGGGDDDENENAKPPALPGMAPLAKDGDLARARSLSRVFNAVPKDRPSIEHCQSDLLEYYAHLACLQTEPAVVWQEKQNLQRALGLVLEDSNGQIIQRFGRLFTRVQLAALSISLGCLLVDDEEEARGGSDNRDDNSDGVLPAHRCSSQQWKHFVEQLQMCRNSCIRRDANAFVPLGQNDGATNVHEEDSALDKTLEEHNMFQTDFNEAIQLLRVQQIAAQLREQLAAIAQSREDGPKDKTKKKHPSSMLKEAVEQYESNLSPLFGGRGVDPPRSLTKFLKNESSTSAAMKQQNTQGLAMRLHNDCLRVVRGGSTTFSFSTAQQKTRDLLLKWSESILSCPTLVRLGYGGVRAPLVTQNDEDHDNDDVSSYGMDEEFARLDATENSRTKRGPKTSATSDERFPKAARGRSRSNGSGSTRQEEDERKTSDDDEALSDKEDQNAAAEGISPAAAQAGATAQTIIKPRRPEKAPRRLSMEQRASFTSQSQTAAAATAAQESNVVDSESGKDSPKEQEGSNGTQKDKDSDKKQKRKHSASRERSSPVSVPASRSLEVLTVDDSTDESTSSTSSLGFSAYAPKPKSSRNKRRAVDPNPQSGADSADSPPTTLKTTITKSQEAALWNDAENQNTGSFWKRQRTAWSQDESDAVREGYLLYGPRWRLIKDNCNNRLQHRTNVQIKDKFRTMVKRGEIQLKEEDSEGV